MKCWHWVLCGVVVTLLAVVASEGVLVFWVGSADLEVVFVVVDAATDQPVAGADVEVLSDGGFHRERDEKGFTLRTDAAGAARRVCHDSMSFGARSRLGFTNSRSIHLPWWHFRVTAPGYATTDWTELETVEPRPVKEWKGREVELVVRVPLHRTAP